MALAYSFIKDKLPRGFSFPLKRSVLDAALLEAGIAGVSCVFYRHRKSGDIVMDADYHGEGWRGWPATRLSSVCVYSVPSGERHAIEAHLVSEVLPRLVRWLKMFEPSGDTRHRVARHPVSVNQHFEAAWEAGAAMVSLS